MATELTNQKLEPLYNTDYNLWILETVNKLQSRGLDSRDWENLIEEF